MSRSTLPTKVGLFVVIALGLLAFLILSFSKGASLLHPTYTIRLRTADVGGIKEKAQVLLGGLKIGSVSGIGLATDGKTVMLMLHVEKRYPLRQDARFTIEQSGFLGDQHVAIYPQSSTAPLLTDGAEVQCEEPFNLQDAARAATGFIQRIDQTAQRLNEAILRVDRVVLNEQSLSNVNIAMANFRSISDRTLSAVDRIDTLIASNAEPIHVSVENFQRFSQQMDDLGRRLNGTIDENRTNLDATFQNLRSASSSLDQIAKDLNSGQGLAGGLLRDKELKESLRQTVFHFEILSSNLSKYGLLYKPRAPKPEASKSGFEAHGSQLLTK